MSEGGLAVGDSLESQCTRCKKATRHIVVSLVGEAPAKVECTICEGVHNFRPPKSGRSAAGPRTTRKVKAAGPRGGTPRRWEDVSRDLDPSRAVPYAMTGRFAANDWVRHPSFGMGLVQKTIRPNKMEVLFQEGVKVLRCSL